MLLFFFTPKLLDTLTENKGAEQDHGSHQHCEQQQQKFHQSLPTMISGALVMWGLQR
jgi:hypothetical protein